MPSTGLRTAPPGPPGTRDVPARGRRPHRMWLRWWHPVRMYRVRGYAVAWLFLLPALLLFTYFKFIPMARAVQLSFYEVLYKGDVWVGNANYREVVTDSSFLSAIWHTVELAVGQTAGSIVLGLFLALLLEGQARYLWFIRSAVFLPTVAAMAVVAEVWRVLYYPAPDLARDVSRVAPGVRDPDDAGRHPRAARVHRGVPAHRGRAERLDRGAHDTHLQAWSGARGARRGRGRFHGVARGHRRAHRRGAGRAPARAAEMSTPRSARTAVAGQLHR